MPNHSPDGGVSGAAAWGERLPRTLGLASAVAVIVGTTIGSGIFRTPAVIAERVPSVGGFLAVWLVGGMLALAGALAFAELASMFPRSGGFYVFVREAFGRPVAFLFGWACLIVIRPASYGAIATVCAEYLWRLLGGGGEGHALRLPMTRIQLTAAALIVVVSAVNYRGARLGARVQNVSTILKVAALLALALLGLALAPESARIDPPMQSAATWSLSAFGLALVSVLWAYDGFADLAYSAGEVREPRRNLPRAIVLGTFAIIAIYLLVNWVYVRVLTLPGMAVSPLVADEAAGLILGAGGRVFVALAVVVSTFGAINGICMTGPRIFFAMAEDRLFFRGIAQVHPRYQTPGRAIVLLAILSVGFVSLRTFAQLADQFIIGIWPFYALSAAGLFVLRRRRPTAERPYRTWGYPLVPAAFLVASLFLLGNYLLAQPLLVAVNVLVVAAGLPVYWLWLRRPA